MDTNTSEPEDHPLSEKQTNTDDKKFETTTAALTDPNFPLPELDESTSYARHALSFFVLLALLVGGCVGAWFFEPSFLQVSENVWVQVGILAGMAGFTLMMLFFTGTVWIDWWELVLGYWWLSIPIAAAAGLVFVLNQESAMTLKEVE